MSKPDYRPGYEAVRQRERREASTGRARAGIAAAGNSGHIERFQRTPVSVKLPKWGFK